MERRGDGTAADYAELLRRTARVMSELGDIHVHEVVLTSVDDRSRASSTATIYYSRPDPPTGS